MYIVAYDISDANERRRAVLVIEQYCFHEQKSVWCCGLGLAKVREMSRKLDMLGLKTGFVEIWEAHEGHDLIGVGEPIEKQPACYVV